MINILVFTEGTILMHLSGKNVNREERVRQSKMVWIQKIKRLLKFNTKVVFGSIEDYKNYIPVGNSVEKINKWKEQGVEIFYLTSKKIKNRFRKMNNLLS